MKRKAFLIVSLLLILGDTASVETTATRSGFCVYLPLVLRQSP